MPPRYYYKVKTQEGKIEYKALWLYLEQGNSFENYEIIKQITAKEYYTKGGR